MSSILSRYASLLTHYCLRVTPGDKILISSTTLAEPLVREVYREVLAAGAALVECEQEPILQVVIGENPKVTYGKVNVEVAEQIMKQHVQNGLPVKDYVLPI